MSSGGNNGSRCLPGLDHMFLKMKGKGLMPGEGRVAVQIFICKFRSHYNAQLCHSLSMQEKVFCILDTSSILNCSPRITREVLELSNFLLPLCWASVPLGGFVPNSRVESEVALTTKHMLENERGFTAKPRRAVLGLFTFSVNILFCMYCTCQEGHSWSGASHSQGRHSQELTYSWNLRMPLRTLISSLSLLGLSREYQFFLLFRQSHTRSPHTLILDILPSTPNGGVLLNLLSLHRSPTCFLDLPW